jgi:uncharacterized protein (TIGR03083 family)
VANRLCGVRAGVSRLLPMTSEQDQLWRYVEAWQSSVADVLVLLRALDDEDWARPTDLPGWDVHAVAAHLAHLESELAGVEQAVVEVPELAHIRSPMGRYTEMGPLARTSAAPDAVIDELERSAGARLAMLGENPPSDGAGRPPITPGGIGWDWETLLSNRVVDMWMHEQDIRRATGRPGGMDSPGAAHTAAVFVGSFGYAVGKRVAPPAGTTVVLEVTGANPVRLAVQVNPEGRAVRVADDAAAPAAEPAVGLRMDTETFIVLGGGRRSPEEVDVAVVGDRELGRRVLAAMAVTP